MATCENCGAGFGPVRRDARFCSARCRQAARRRRLRAEAEARRYAASRALVDRLAFSGRVGRCRLCERRHLRCSG